MPNIVQGKYGEAPIELDLDSGILKMANKQGVLFRVKLINRLFATIVEKDWHWILLKKAGITMGEDYAIDWILTNWDQEIHKVTANYQTQTIDWQLSLPIELRQVWSEMKRISDEAERESMDVSELSLDRIEKMKNDSQYLTELELETKEKLQHHLRNLPSKQIAWLWQRMHDEDVFAGWGKSKLVGFDFQNFTAEIEVTASFIARLYYYWDQQGKTGKRNCSLLEGYFLGEAALLFGRDDLECIETHCRLKGDTNCIFEITREQLLIR